MMKAKLTSNHNNINHNFSGVKEAMKTGINAQERLKNGFKAWLEGPETKNEYLEIMEYATLPGDNLRIANDEYKYPIYYKLKNAGQPAEELVNVFVRQLLVVDREVKYKTYLLGLNETDKQFLNDMFKEWRYDTQELLHRRLYEIDSRQKYANLQDCIDEHWMTNKVKENKNEIVMNEKEAFCEGEKLQFNYEVMNKKKEAKKNNLQFDEKKFYSEKLEKEQKDGLKNFRPWSEMITWLKDNIDLKLEGDDKNYYEALALLFKKDEVKGYFQSSIAEKQMQIAKTQAMKKQKKSGLLFQKKKWSKITPIKMFSCLGTYNDTISTKKNENGKNCKGGRKKSRRKSRKRKRTHKRKKKKKSRRRKSRKKSRRRRR